MRTLNQIAKEYASELYDAVLNFLRLTQYCKKQ